MISTRDETANNNGCGCKKPASLEKTHSNFELAGLSYGVEPNVQTRSPETPDRSVWKPVRSRSPETLGPSV